MQKTKELQSVHPMIVEPVALFNRMEEIQQEIARRAFELFEGRGKEPGRDFEDWSAAEAQLLAAVAIDLVESNENFKIVAKVPGFSEKDIQIAVEPNRVFLSGKMTEELTSESGEGSGRRESMFFKGIDLPAEIDLEKAEARLKDGKLTVTLPKAASSVQERTKNTEAAKKANPK